MKDGEPPDKSKLSKLKLGWEFDRTLTDIKKELRERTYGQAR